MSIDEALAFHERLHAEAMPVAGLVANRVTPDSGRRRARSRAGRSWRRRSRRRGAATAGFASRLAATLGEHQALAGAERRALERLFARVAAPRAVVSRLETDVHDLAGPRALAERL